MDATPSRHATRKRPTLAIGARRDSRVVAYAWTKLDKSEVEIASWELELALAVDPGAEREDRLMPVYRVAL
ncbi:MAG TPA: hypothetical protein VFZ53_05570 [Polyangiaceae bacterium]